MCHRYLLAFYRLLLPVATKFNPDLVLISAGFDAAQFDPLGGCKVCECGRRMLGDVLSSDKCSWMARSRRAAMRK